ncbi:MAG: hypothetical protein A2782_01815 [Candidatus Blackburnbacteria bacterium RIFCSPHIGHO2_01_FULL_43_15b]|uniref:Uncharacterized protein n=1 Tax=Candidatus Blackburnbacteria bacterium RIFCSPHIGHO2_01_FULL_43_15b TaxID=1797513 RepID=A0A1G1V1G2_9BACT|nr:MAG: hypothetical protein A2782_01815 [Candidatus Blackburnbacteria bacterium RIFCSPHIGHO2_01_FULL_43_15b]
MTNSAHLHVKAHGVRHHHSVLVLLIPALIFAIVLAWLLENLPWERVKGAATESNASAQSEITSH